MAAKKVERRTYTVRFKGGRALVLRLTPDERQRVCAYIAKRRGR